jgi:AcrR family transcriptional regulator
MGTREESERTKQRLIEAAGDIFARLGFEGANVRQIASQAGIAFGTIAYHFGGKEGLYRAVLRAAVRPMEDLAAVERQLAGLPAREALRQLVQSLVREAACEEVNWRNRLIDRECLELSPAFRELLGEHWVPELRLLRVVLARAAGVDSEGDAAVLAAIELHQSATLPITYRELIDQLAPGLVHRIRESDRHVDRLIDVAVFAARRAQESAS